MKNLEITLSSSIMKVVMLVSALTIFVHILKSHHMPFYEDWTHKFDKSKRFLNDMLFSFNLSLGYLCFFEMSSQEFDRLLRALTMSNLVKSYEASSHDDNQGAYREATRCS